MIEKYFLPIFGILSLGWIILKIIDKNNLISNSLDKFIASTIIGYSLLIMPLVILGVFFDNVLNYYVYFFYSISLIFFLYLLIKLLLNIEINNLKMKNLNFEEKIMLSTLISIVLIYLIIALIYYERGWDALQYYFPNAYYFYIVNDIPLGANPITLYPTFKPPLNTLLIMYSFYVNKGIQNQVYSNVHSWIFLITTMMIVLRLTFILTKKIEISLFAGLIFLVMPSTYFLMYEYMYYQDLSLLFFMSATLYFILINKTTSVNSINKYSVNIYLLIASLSASLAILSKITGFITIILIILSVGSNSKFTRFGKIIILIIVTGILIYKSIFDVYYGYGVLLIFIFIYLVILILSNKKGNLNINKIIGLSILPVVFGSIWIYFMTKIPKITNFLIYTYIKSNSKSIQYNYPTYLPQEIFLENGVSVSFSSSLLYLLTGTFFSLSWIVPKTISLFIVFLDNNKTILKENKYILKAIHIYTITFVLIWFGYYGSISARYLIPISPFLSILISLSFYYLLEKLKANSKKMYLKLSFIFSGALFYFPFFPISSLMVSQLNYRLYSYHNNQVELLIYGVFFSITFLLLSKIKYDIKLVKYETYVKSFTILIILLFSAPQLYMLHINQYNINDFNSDANYFYRDNYQDLIKNLVSMDLEYSDTILSINTPGLPYYISRSVVDVLMVFKFIDNKSDLIFFEEEAEALEFIKENNIYNIILLNSSHAFYDVYLNQYSNLEIFKITSNRSIFSIIYSNDEYIVFNRFN